MDSSERWQRKRARKKEARAEKRADLQAQYEEARRAAGPLSGKAHLEGCLSFLRWLCPRCDYETDFVNHPTKYGVGSPDPDATAADEAKQEQNHASGSVHWQKTAARHRLEDWKKRCKRTVCYAIVWLEDGPKNSPPARNGRPHWPSHVVATGHF
eukprot:TRINITY_DN15010_c0_g2_i1.p2 TRINITY_DN15010_c0_g2~~TRINITY_DN15010_c0_g2_i1.p2  ORF type:complete len:155 (-),score=10.31 TRINITY_DN15010_c0_g2_i1:1254-1718(-)